MVISGGIGDTGHARVFNVRPFNIGYYCFWDSVVSGVLRSWSCLVK